MKNARTIYLYVTIFLTGSAVLVLEILGTRIVSPFYGATIFVWTSLISVTLGALALGYFLGGRVIDKRPTTHTFFSSVFLAGVFFILPMKIDQWTLMASFPLGLKYGPLAASMGLFFVPLLILGMLSPMVIRLVTKDREGSGSSSGGVFAISTVGSIFGGILSGFYLIPSFSISGIFTGISILLVSLGIIGLVVNGKLEGTFRVFVLLGSVLMASLVILPRLKVTPGNTFTVLEHRQSYLGDIKVVDLRGVVYSRCLYVNGSGQTCVNEKGETDGFFQRFLKDEVDKFGLDESSKILVLGLGGGGILSMLPEEATIDVVELDQEIVDVAKKYFHLQNYPNVTVTIDDARHFLMTSKGHQYDLVLENIALGSGIPSYILSSESFSDMKRLLKPSGVLLAHIGSFEIEGDNLFNNAVYSTAAGHFKYSLALSSQSSRVSHLVLYLSDNPIDINFGDEVYVADMVYDTDLIVVDDRNPLEHYYLSNAILQREYTLGRRGIIFYAN